MTTFTVNPSLRVKKHARREPDPNYNNGMLRSDESYEEFSRFIESRISKVKSDREYANKVLYATGMYDRDGKLKEEFK